MPATIDAEQLREWKAEHPGAVVVSYVNTTAEVKAESDYCCTSGNAVEIVNSIPADQDILFLPDMFLGAHVRRVTGRENIHVWMGECHVHAGIDPEHIALQRGARIRERSCSFIPSAGARRTCSKAVSAGDIDPKGVQILSTEGMIRRPIAVGARTSSSSRRKSGFFTACGKANPNKTLLRGGRPRVVRVYEGHDVAEKVQQSLEALEHRLPCRSDVADRARRAIERMVAIGGTPAMAPAFAMGE